MVEVDISKQEREIPIKQFLLMYNGYIKSPNDKIYHLNQTTFTGEYVLKFRFEDMLTRELAFRAAQLALGNYEPGTKQGKRPTYVWIVKPTNKVCNVNTTFLWQPNNYTCGVTCLRMGGSRHGSIPDYNKVVNMSGCNPNNGTGHIGMRTVLKNLMGFSTAKSVYRKDYPWNKIKELMEQGYDVHCNIMTGGLSGWVGDYAHWVLLYCLNDNYVWIEDPDKGSMIRHDIYTMNDCLDRNQNPDFVIAKK